MRKTILNPSEEMITYKHRVLGDQLTALFNEVYSYLQNNSFDNLLSEFKTDINKEKVSVEVALANIIKNNTNMNIEVDLFSNSIASLMIFPFNRNHVLLKDYIRNMYYLKGEKEILKNSKNKEGTIDLEKGTLGGIFTEYKHTLYLNLHILMVTYGLLPTEVTAVVLHEIGHVFTYYEYSNRVNSTNQLLAELSEEIHNKRENPEKVELIFKELKSTLNLSDKEYDDLYNNLDKTIFGPKLFKLYIKEVSGLRKIVKYDETSSEALADNFAVRMGYGKELILGLDKLHKFSPERNDVILAMMLTGEFIMDFIITPVIIVFLFVGFPSPIIGTALALLLFLEFLGSSNILYKDMTYDELKQRYNRVRQAMIGRLKDLNIKSDEMKNIVESLDEIDNLMKEVNNTSSLKERILGDFIPSSRKVSKDIQRQKDMEELSFNPLFIAAAKLRIGE